MATIYRCRRSFAIGADGGTRVIPAGAVVSSADPILRNRPDLLADTSVFEPLGDYVNRSQGVESATAEPGEKRSIQPPSAPVEPPETADTPRRSARRRAVEKGES